MDLSRDQLLEIDYFLSESVAAAYALDCVRSAGVPPALAERLARRARR
jgi:hypothetical protein